MSQFFENRTRAKLPKPGPYVAEVTNHLDPMYMGRLEVAIFKGIPNFVYRKEDTYVVKYVSPFAGQTSVRFEGNNSSDFNDVQKSYGFWMIPPDVGAKVIVIFIDGDPNQGYWFGCIPDNYQNHMVPGIAASFQVAATQEQKEKYGTSYLPVAEFNKGTQTLKIPNPNTLTKPIHPFADRLLAQGLLLDTVRGVTSSSARREVPSQIFGISTPGPLDKSPNAKRGKIGYGAGVQAPVSRLGGTTFVMDDGDVNGENELVRLRTRTGHQILLHNSQDLIYIANSQGTAWIELTSNGKIDIYAQDSVSIHSEADFNFRADRDINLEAGRNINLAAVGDLQLDNSGNFVINSKLAGKMTFGTSLDIKAFADVHIETDSNLHVKSAKLYAGSSGDLHLVSGGAMYKTATNDINVKSGGIYKETASKIYMNSKTAEAASGTSPEASTAAPELPTYSLPGRSISAGWSNKNFYASSDIISIMKRVPTHEPWPHHENINPEGFMPYETDAKASTEVGSKPSVVYNKNPIVSGTPPKPTGDVPSDNLTAFLWMIRVLEGTSGPDGYKTQYTGKTFDSYADHPREAITAPINGKNVTSTAAGAYQFLTKTWDMCKKSLELADFSPPNQDKAAVYLIQNGRALDDVKAGRFSSAVAKCNVIWASLPGSPYGQNAKSFNVALSVYKQAGGTFVS